MQARPDTEAAYWQRCAVALDQALNETPFYAPWRALDPGAAAPLAARYAALPALTKADIRAHFPRGFVPAGVDYEAELARGRVSYVSTSGSTADQVTLFWAQAWWDHSERESWALNAHLLPVADGRHREAVLASPRCVGPCRPGEALSMAERTLGRLLFLNQTVNPANWTDVDTFRMIGELEAFRPVVLEANPFYLAALAAFALDRGVIALLRRRLAAGVPFMGLSAGSIMLARGWVRWAESPREQDALLKCLGFAPLYCDVHGEADGWDELKALLRLLPAGAVGYGIPAVGALRICDGVIEAVG